jgi:hypothetical protein
MLLVATTLTEPKPDATGRPKFADAFSRNFSQLMRLSNVGLVVQRPGLPFIFLNDISIKQIKKYMGM